MAQRAMCHPSLRTPFVVLNEPKVTPEPEKPSVKKKAKKKGKSNA